MKKIFNYSIVPDVEEKDKKSEIVIPCYDVEHFGDCVICGASFLRTPLMGVYEKNGFMICEFCFEDLKRSYVKLKPFQ